MSGAASSVRPNQKFSKDRSCPICGGHNQERRAEGKRCYGFVSEDGEWAHCTREEHAGDAPYNAKSEAYVHKLSGVCRCGMRHGLGSEARKGRGTSSKARIATTYDYRDEHGQLLYQTVRLEPKGFYQRRPDGSGDWIHSLQGVRRVLYGLPELLAADEGERERQRAEVERLEALTAQLVELDEATEVLARAALVASGYHRHKGEWRRARNT